MNCQRAYALSPRPSQVFLEATGADQATMEQAAEWMVERMSPGGGAREYLEAELRKEGVLLELRGAPSIAQTITRACDADAEFTCPVFTPDRCVPVRQLCDGRNDCPGRVVRAEGAGRKSGPVKTAVKASVSF